MDASTIRRRYGELIQKIKSFRMAIGDYGSLLKLSDAKKPLRAPSARRTGNTLRPGSGRLSQAGKAGCLGTTPSHTLATGPLQIPTIGNILQNGNSFSLVDTITQARAMLSGNKQFRPFVQAETAVPPVPRSFPVRASTDQLGPLQPITPRRKAPTVRPKSGARCVDSVRGQRPPSCRRRREAAPCSPVNQPNVHIESPKFIRLLYEDLLRALCLLRNQLGRQPAQNRRTSHDGVHGLDVEWQQLDGLVSDLERQLRACEVLMLKAGAKVETPPPSPPPPVRALSPVVSECVTDVTSDTTTTVEEPARTAPTSAPWSRTKLLPSTSTWHQPIVPRNMCLRRSDTTLQASPRLKRLPRQAYPLGSSFPEVPPLPLLKQRTFVNVITGTSPTIGVVSRKHVKPTREKTWSF